MTIGELISILEEQNKSDTVVLEIDGIIDECVNIYSEYDNKVIIRGTQ